MLSADGFFADPYYVFADPFHVAPRNAHIVPVKKRKSPTAKHNGFYFAAIAADDKIFGKPQFFTAAGYDNLFFL
jgi:hypothetical protein